MSIFRISMFILVVICSGVVGGFVGFAHPLQYVCVLILALMAGICVGSSRVFD